MTKRMLIDATHQEETRVAVCEGNRIIEYEYESVVRKQLKGSIFLAKVTRVEPSLQAAFVNFGGNRHGFLPFSEIHPDYFRIPVADREALIAEQQALMDELAAAEEAEYAAEEAAYEAAMAKNRGETTADDSAANESQPLPLPESFEEVGGLTAELNGDFEPSAFEAEASEDEAEEEFEDSEDSEEDESQDFTEVQQAESSEDGVEAGAEGEQAEPRRPHVGPSRRGDKYWIWKAVSAFDAETFTYTELNEAEATSFDFDTAQKIKDASQNMEGVARARLWYNEGEETNAEGVKCRGVWIALKADNESQLNRRASSSEDGEEGEESNNNRGGRGGRFRGRGGKGRGNGRGGRSPMRTRRVDMLGGEGVEGEQTARPSLRKNYKIQEVVKRGQIMLIQVQKEERGNKGAAVTTYLSLPGRYCVLMPNSPRGGGVSRKIASFAERKRMREILAELSVPDGMSVILRTAGVARTKVEIKRDLDYLMRLWDNVRELTLQSTAPSVIYEESNLVKRSVRDIYDSEIEEIWVAGDEGYKEAKNFMKMLMPSHSKRVQQYKDERIPLFHRYQVENQISEMSEPVVTLRSGGYLVINPTEALISIDVNSGRATKERHIEETALKTNLEAAEEVARQLRLRDLGGLVVIDFIDMEDYRNNARVERRLKEALSSDRARIQVGRISSFGLLELSRQRLNPSLTEAQYEKCPHCKGAGHIRTVDSATILALRALEEEGIKSRADVVYLTVPASIALYLLNQKRERLNSIEARFGFDVFIKVDDSLEPCGYQIEPVKALPGENIRRKPAQNQNVEVEDAEFSESEAEDVDMEAEEEEFNKVESEEDDINGNDRSYDDSQSARGNDRDRGGRGGRGRGRGGRFGNNDRAERSGGGRGGRGRNNRNDRDNTQDERPSEAEHDNAAPVKAAEEKKSAEKPQAQPAAAANSGFKAKRFTSRKAEGDASAAPESSAPAIQAAAPSNDIEQKDEAVGRKKGWWNKLIE